MGYMGIIKLQMRTNASKQIQAINQLLKQQRKSITKLRLFDMGGDEQTGKVNFISSSKKPKYSIDRSKLMNSNAYQQKTKDIKRDWKSNSRQWVQYGDEDQLYKMDLSPVSRISLFNKPHLSPDITRKLIPIKEQPHIMSHITNKQIINSSQPQFNLHKSATEIQNIGYQKVQQYLVNHQQLFSLNKSPQLVYRLMHGLLDQFKVTLYRPFIKQYKNCTYFGQVYQNDINHQGFLIFEQQKKVYYGCMSIDKKHGKGVQIDFTNNIVYKGTFNMGRKKGVFQVIRPYQKYIGQLVNDKYEGKGKLFTDVSIYNGYFSKGLRHGQGEQFFPQSGLKISGTFIQNNFTNNQQKLQDSRMVQYSRSVKKSRYKSSKLYQNPQDITNKSKLEQSRYNFQGYNYDLRPTQHYQFIKPKKRSIRKSGFIFKRRKSIEQQQPLARIIH